MRNKFNSTDEVIIEKIKIIFSDVAVRKILLSFGLTTVCAIFVFNFPITFLFSLLFLVVAVMFYAFINIVMQEY